MNLKELAHALLKIHDDMSRVDASELGNVVAAVKARIHTGEKAKSSWKRDNHTLELKVTIPDSDDDLEFEWQLWDGNEHHKGPTLQAAFDQWKVKWMSETALSLDAVAGVLDPKLRTKITAAGST